MSKFITIKPPPEFNAKFLFIFEWIILAILPL